MFIDHDVLGKNHSCVSGENIPYARQVSGRAPQAKQADHNKAFLGLSSGKSAWSTNKNGEFLRGTEFGLMTNHNDRKIG